MLAAGELRPIDGYGDFNPTNGLEAVMVDLEGKLLGVKEKGYATLFASCEDCGWKHHQHFRKLGGTGHDAAHDVLVKLHSVQAPERCSNTLIFHEEFV